MRRSPSFASSHRLADEHALAERQPVRLQHHGEFAFFDVRERGIVIVERFIGGGRDAVLFHQFFANALARFDLGGALVRAEYLVPAPFQLVRKPQRERVVGSDDRISDVGMGVHPIADRPQVAIVDVDALRKLCDARIPFHAIDLTDQRAFGERRHDGVLAAAVADHQNVQQTAFLRD